MSKSDWQFLLEWVMAIILMAWLLVAVWGIGLMVGYMAGSMTP